MSESVMSLWEFLTLTGNCRGDKINSCFTKVLIRIDVVWSRHAIIDQETRKRMTMKLTCSLRWYCILCLSLTGPPVSLSILWEACLQNAYLF